MKKAFANEWLFKVNGKAETDDKCQECKKDWTKCGKCPVMMQWVKEHEK